LGVDSLNMKTAAASLSFGERAIVATTAILLFQAPDQNDDWVVVIIVVAAAFLLLGLLVLLVVLIRRDRRRPKVSPQAPASQTQPLDQPRQPRLSELIDPFEGIAQPKWPQPDSLDQESVSTAPLASEAYQPTIYTEQPEQLSTSAGDEQTRPGFTEGQRQNDAGQSDIGTQGETFAYLIATHRPTSMIRKYQLREKEMVIGRGKDVDIMLHDTTVSRQHSSVHYESGNFVYQDLKPTNPSLINGRRYNQPHIIKDGDVIFVGETTLVFKLLAQNKETTNE
jgi:hypothetical protein